jgi:hypothetical protein
VLALVPALRDRAECILVSWRATLPFLSQNVETTKAGRKPFISIVARAQRRDDRDYACDDATTLWQ